MNTPLFQFTAVAFAIASLCTFNRAEAQTESTNKNKTQEEQARKEGEEISEAEKKINADSPRRAALQKKSAVQKLNAEQNAQSVQKVTVNGNKQSDTDLRRNSIAGKIVVGREELDRDGDFTVGEILKRLPGVTTGGRPGRGGDVRMRGMGGGYTQILLNGERPPRGFSMESLSPDQVERIEVMRGPVAEFSTQAIAGTINIILREEYHPKDIDLKLALGVEQGKIAPNLSITYPGQIGDLNYALSGSIFRNKQYDEGSSERIEQTNLGLVQLIQDQLDRTNRQSTGLHLTPRLSYRFENGDNLTIQPFLMTSRSHSYTQSNITQTPEIPDPVTHLLPVAFANSNSNADSTFVRLNTSFQHRFEDTSKLTLKIGGGSGRSNSDSLRSQFARSGEQLNLISDVNETRDRSFSQGGKYMTPIGDKQNLAAGWDFEQSQRQQRRISLDNGKPQFTDSGDNLEASTRRFASFVQDEIDINERWSGYLGLRWEGIRIHSSKSDYVVDNSSSVFSPIAHAVFRIPEFGKDQIRMSLTSSYRAPSLNDVIAVPAISPINGPTRPDRSGNPDLRPELSRGFDIAYEHYLKSAGIMSANVFIKSIDDLIRRRTSYVAAGDGMRWVNSPTNIGHALAKGIELEAKFQLQEFFPAGPAIDVRSNYSRFWSSVNDVQGPNNRLDQQPSQTANLGMDYRVAQLPLSLGGNINWTPAYVNQTSDTQTSSSGVKRQLDAYVLWKISPSMKLRLSANNLQANDYLSGSTLAINGVNYLQNNRAKTFTIFNLRVELKI
ncbi:TonB-dependent receptor plug domain-containing protein [Undibacterium fentianense]|uniref:TonB-dependent receptor n=1 Tax=Undibacterium fentianense TaxID=2828728 RepID=A0A941DWM6_9BURK|nr:TonB-dependent receptor [Undibacterium fentianense]MBR7798699.1 TonB-dependent receptor [Undibacterium fentianense]